MSLSSETDQADGCFDIIGSLPERVPQQNNISHTEGNAGGSGLVQTLYEGPRKCGCCINWVDYLPLNAEEKAEDDDVGLPIVLRHSVTRGEDTSRVSLHSIEIRDPAARALLFPVFHGFDGLNPSINYLVFHAPFKPFFYRWAEFSQAVDSCPAAGTKAILEKLRTVVKAQLAEAFAIRNELVGNGVISYPYLWTIFQPGEMVCKDQPAGGRRFYYLEELKLHTKQPPETELCVQHVDYTEAFTLVETAFFIPPFQGTRRITELPVYPVRFVPDPTAARQAAVARGRKFASLTGVHCKEYADRGGCPDGEGPGQFRRVVLDTQGGRRRSISLPLKPEEEMPRITGGITQVPPDAPPVGGHISLRMNRWDYQSPEGDSQDGDYAPPRLPRYHDYNTPVDRPARNYSPPGRRRYRPRPGSLRRTPQDCVVRVDDDGEEHELDEFHLQMCTNIVEGFCLKNKQWQSFYVDGIRDVEWNPDPFSTLVLPDGYKDLVLSFVEAHVGGGQQPIGDVVHGKNGGLVVSLTGPPGVGKTLTAESVAEVLKVPIYVLDLGQVAGEVEDAQIGRPVMDIEGRRRITIEDAFSMAARWKALVLVDECDLYLEPRSESTPVRNRVVTKFLREVEYSSSLVFLTTNRPDALDPAIASRVHLTVSYPQLDRDARRAIWETLLAHNGARALGDSKLGVLADLELNGRRIRNVVKAAAIMAGRNKRGIEYKDIKTVLRITEPYALAQEV